MSLPSQPAVSNPARYTRKSNSDETATPNQSGYSWWSWRRPNVEEKPKENVNTSLDYSSRDVNTQQYSESPQKPSPNTTLSSQKSTDETNEKLKKTLRLTSEQIVSVRLRFLFVFN